MHTHTRARTHTHAGTRTHTCMVSCRHVHACAFTFTCTGGCARDGTDSIRGGADRGARGGEGTAHSTDGRRSGRSSPRSACRRECGGAGTPHPSTSIHLMRMHPHAYAGRGCMRMRTATRGTLPTCARCSKHSPLISSLTAQRSSLVIALRSSLHHPSLIAHRSSLTTHRCTGAPGALARRATRCGAARGDAGDGRKGAAAIDGCALSLDHSSPSTYHFIRGSTSFVTRNTCPPTPTIPTSLRCSSRSMRRWGRSTSIARSFRGCVVELAVAISSSLSAQ